MRTQVFAVSFRAVGKKRKKRNECEESEGRGSEEQAGGRKAEEEARCERGGTKPGDASSSQ